MAMHADRTFRDILAASCLARCPIPFSCALQTFANLNGSQVGFEIIDGEGFCRLNPPEPSSPPNYDRQVSVMNGVVFDDDPFADQLTAISDYFQENISHFFNAQVIDLTLTFGEIDDGLTLHLLDGSATTAINGFTLNLFSEIPGGEQALTEFMTDQLSCVWDSGRVCVTGDAHCTTARYQCPRIFVVLYRAHKRFPTVNKARLYRVLKARFQAIDPDFSHELASVCIGCLHVYTAEERTYQAQKVMNQLPTLLAPPAFEALVPSELAVKGKRDVGATPNGLSAYTYYINLVKSPYRTPPVPNLTPARRTVASPVRPIPTPEPWADRLSHAAITPPFKCLVNADADPFRETEFTEAKPWVPPTNVSYSQRLAARMYENKPFTYEFLERVRERANRNVWRTRKLTKSML
jgi:hypothetical protein